MRALDRLASRLPWPLEILVCLVGSLVSVFYWYLEDR
jgi:hypothetical protein